MFKNVVSNESITPKTTAFCKSSFDPEKKSGKIFVAFDLMDGSIYEYTDVFPSIPSNNYLAYVAIAVAVEYLRLRDAKGIIYSSSELVVRQLNGEYEVNTPEFLPFFNFIRENVTNDISIEFKSAKEIKFSKRPKGPIDKDIILKIQTLMAESICLTAKHKRPLPQKYNLYREKKIKESCTRRSNREYGERQEAELRALVPKDDFLSGQNDNNNSEEDDYNDDENS